MSWREQLLLGVGAGYLSGVTLGDWWRLLRQNRFAVAPACLLRAASITAQSIPNSIYRLYEERRYARRLGRVNIHPPLFVLGFFRHGTTHLHNLLSIDPRFAWPNMYQANFPHTFLTTEAMSARIAGFLVPKVRPQDNVRLGMDVPYEDEIAMVSATGLSPYLSFVFPRQSSHYLRYFTFQDVPQDEVRRWQQALRCFLRKLTLKYDKPLVLKSPPHTARVRLLLEMFPDARFVHICRHPYDVFPSAVNTIMTALRWFRLQRADAADVAEEVIRNYRVIYQGYFAERALIPKGHLHELSFEDLEREPVAEMRRLYASLHLPPFALVEPDLARYLESLTAYRKNDYPRPPADVRARLRGEWQQCFAEWGYAP